MLLIRIAGGVVLVFLIVAFFVRGRVAGHAGASPKKSKSRADFRPTLPPSPYQPSRGFRILDGQEPVDPLPVQLPQLDPKKEFVFNDTQVTPSEIVPPPQLRHDEKWALDRSMRHAPHPRLRRRQQLAWVIAIVLVVAGVVVVLAMRHSPPVVHHGALAMATAVRML